MFYTHTQFWLILNIWSIPTEKHYRDITTFIFSEPEALHFILILYITRLIEANHICEE